MTDSLIRRNKATAENRRRPCDVPLRTSTVLLMIVLPCSVALRLLLHVATNDAVNTSTRTAMQTEEQITQDVATLNYIEVEIPKKMTIKERYKDMYRRNKKGDDGNDADMTDVQANGGSRSEDDPCRGKEEFLPILQTALAHLLDGCASREDMLAAKQSLRGVSDIFGITTCDVRDLCSRLGRDTTWEQVVEQYYFKQRNAADKQEKADQMEEQKPVSIQVIGTRTCPTFREGLMPQTPDGRILEPEVRVAGLFHSGLNVMAETLHVYHLSPVRDIEDDKSWQVPWGKHTPVQFSTSQVYKDQDWRAILPVVVVRDPYRWMDSLCKSRDGRVPWKGGKPLKCPSLVLRAANTGEESSTTNSTVSMQPNKFGIYWHPEEYPDSIPEEYNSLGDLWADWYNEYLLADFPRLLVRYEDLLFFPEQVMRVIAECIGTELTPAERSTIHTSGDISGGDTTADLIRALAKHGTIKGRTDQLSRQDLEYAQITMADLMDWFGYQTILH